MAEILQNNSAEVLFFQKIIIFEALTNSLWEKETKKASAAKFISAVTALSVPEK
jgi:hypothetical protein